MANPFSGNKPYFRSRDKTRNKLVFLRNGVRTELESVGANETLLSYLRLREKGTGTKEGCNEGDCGACTVALGRLRDGKLHYEPVNACIQLLGQIDGADLITIEDLQEDGVLHKLQQAMVASHGSQCGFCTPGIVMALFCLLHSGEKIDRASVNAWLAGNLCRCTGYRPIVDAALAAAKSTAVDFLKKRFARTEKALAALEDQSDLFIGDENSFFAAPSSLSGLSRLCADEPEAVIVGGATDAGLWITKKLQRLPKIIWTGRAKDFATVIRQDTKTVIGGGVRYCDCFDALETIAPDMGTVLTRLGSRQVRASGTIGGNIANGSPIGDMPPMLIALGASLELRLGKQKRVMPLEQFFIDYGKQDRQPGELVAKITILRLKPNEYFKAYKISKRFDQDISAILFALKLSVSRGRITKAVLACGGMAAIPKRAARTEVALTGLHLDKEASWQEPIKKLAEDFNPISDMRASADYRSTTVQNLLYKALCEIAREAGVVSTLPMMRVSGFTS